LSMQFFHFSKIKSRYFPVPRAAARFITACLVLPAVFFLSLLAAGAEADPPAGRPVSFLNDRAADITGAAAVNAPGFSVPEGLTGEGRIVAIADSGLDAGQTGDVHPDLQSTPGRMPKVVMLKSWAGREIPDDPDGHGTHMAATVAGTGAASDGKFRGVAPEASIYFQAILNDEGNPEPPADLAGLFRPAYSAGARVHVDGWGGGPNAYLASSAQVDKFVRAHPDFLVVFGAGNGGPSPGSLTAEANSKNALAAGASVLPRPALVPGEGDTASSAEFSSRGPAGDGRIKPELLAPASAVISARSRLVEGNLPGFPQYTRLQGTSMAAAVTGGAALLLQEYFEVYLDLPGPSAALVKAALVNGARPAAAGGPSESGFGVLDLAGTVLALKDGAFRPADDWDGVPAGECESYTFRVDDPGSPFKATLAWTDPPAEPGSGHTLVNNLDLTVQTPDGRLYHGNHFLGTNAPDGTNNVEQVYLPSPVPGEYTVRVTGTGVRRNTVRGSAVPAQDYALVYGQAPAVDMVKDVDGQKIKTVTGKIIDQENLPTVNLLNGTVVTADAAHIFPGAACYLTPRGAYLTAGLWRAGGVKAFQAEEEMVFTEINPDDRLGGYVLAEDAGAVLLNKSPVPPAGLPPGFEISAVVNPVDQKIRRVRAAFIEREGVVKAVENEGGRKKITLEGGAGTYRIAGGAVYSYEDSYAGVDTADMPFGTGALEELEEILPGMPVCLRLSPSSGAVQYLAVKRLVALGTVREVAPADGKVELENGGAIRLFPGAPVKLDGKASRLEALKPGDHVSAVLLPDTGEAIGLVAYSSMVYGKAIDFVNKIRTLYLLGDDRQYRSFYLPRDAVIYRWGMKAVAEAIAPGLWTRLITGPAGSEVWRMDLADTLFASTVVAGYEEAAGVITTAAGEKYRVSGSTRIYKDGYPVMPEALRPGEQIVVEYAAAPPPTGNVILTGDARSSGPPPFLTASAVPLQDRLVVTGRTAAGNEVYIWTGDRSRQIVPVDASGRFVYSLQRGVGFEEGRKFAVVAVDRRSGSVAGREMSPAGSGYRGGFSTAVLEAVSVAARKAGSLTGRAGAGYLPDAPLTRAEAVAALARLLNWPETSNWSVPFTDEKDVPAAFHPALAEAAARGIIKGYPGGSFFPAAAVSRAEAAVMLARVLHELGLGCEASTLPYSDAGAIPGWAAPAVAETTAAGLFHGRPGDTFDPGAPVTAEETALLLDRLLAACARELSE